MITPTWRSPWSVTRILNAKWPMSPHIPSEALERGTRVHEWTQQYEEGYAPNVEDTSIAGYCDAYKRFCYAFAPSWEHTEHPVDDGRLVHGIIDRVGYLAKQTQRVVADIKTGSPTMLEGRTRDALQLAGYAHLLNPREPEALTRVGIYIRKTGAWKCVVYSDPTDHLHWNALVREVTGDHYDNTTD